jgi:hypothetical protein
MAEAVQRLWEKKNIHSLLGTFSDFMNALDAQVRVSLALPVSHKHPILERVTKRDVALSSKVWDFLKLNVEYVNALKVDSSINPCDFYKGVDLEWSPIALDLDVRRGLVDSLLANHIIEPEEQAKGLQFIVIKAYAGAGKTTALRRIAWDAASDYNCLCLCMKTFGKISSSAVTEIANVTGERIFIFVEDAPENAQHLLATCKSLSKQGVDVTLLSTARTNEWNMLCLELSEYVTDEYDLKYLSHKDIGKLLTLLEKHGALGTLEGLDLESRRQALTERAGRQLLVALHEATLGKSFVEIIRDEYEHVHPKAAQQMYLTICVLNRFSVPVRAGMISRMYNITFDQFKSKFFGPLELIVKTRYNPIIRDYEYSARHPHIAEIVFEEILRDAEERLAECIRCLQNLNVSFEADRKAFRRLTRANDLLQVFPDHAKVRIIDAQAMKTAGDDTELLHQMVIYEMKRPNGSLDEANRLLQTAYAKSPQNYTIVHSLAELKLRLADTKSRTDVEFDHYLRQVRQACLSNAHLLDSYGVATLLKADIRKLPKLLEDDSGFAVDAELEAIVKRIEKNLEEGLQQYPGESYLLTLEAELGDVLSDSERVISALRRS